MVRGASHSFGLTGCRRLKADTDALLAVECCFEHDRRSKTIDWRDFCPIAAYARKCRIDGDANQNCLHPCSVRASTVRRAGLAKCDSFASREDLHAGIHMFRLAEDSAEQALDERCAYFRSSQDGSSTPRTDDRQMPYCCPRPHRRPHPRD